MYRVISYFTDLQDNDHPYNVGDAFPREGVKASKARLDELAGSDNKQGRPLIEKVADEVTKSDEGTPQAAATRRTRAKKSKEN